MKFRNPQNDYEEEITGTAFIWILFFGFFYFAVKGVWRHVFIYIVLTFVTLGICWIIYPFFWKGIMRKHYLKNGWVEISNE